jgi:hapalindole-type alkaloid chlorinase
MKFFNLFRNYKKVDNFQFLELNVEEIIRKFPNALNDLYESKFSGFLVKGFLNNDEINQIKLNYFKMEKKNLAHMKVGYTYPMVFAEFSSKNLSDFNDDQGNTVENYFKRNENYPEEFASDFGFNIKEKLDVFFKSISGGLGIKIPNGFNETGKYPFANFRYLSPNVGKMTIHCGNLFHERFSEFYKDLSREIEVINQMSFFIMINSSEIGGELDVYGLRWEKGQKVIDNTENKEIIILSNGKKINPNNNKHIERKTITPEPGDMILFQGGNIWHRVSDVRGKSPRITFGGFIARDLKKKNFYYWT